MAERLDEEFENYIEAHSGQATRSPKLQKQLKMEERFENSGTYRKPETRQRTIKVWPPARTSS